MKQKNEERIFAIVKKGIIKGLYLFEIEEIENNKMLNHIKTVYTNEVSEEVRDKYNDVILNEAKQYVSLQEYTKVTFDDNVVQIDPKVNKKDLALTSSGGFIIGFLLGWIVFDDLMMGLLYGIIFSPVITGTKVIVTKKRGKKKKNNKEK